jgi:hypothetical protein
MNKRWKPQYDRIYYYISSEYYTGFIVRNDSWLDCKVDYDRFKCGNMFCTKREALKKLRQIKKVLKEREE